MSINVFDVVFGGLFVGIVALGFLGGVVRLGFTLISLYLGAIVATYFYLAVGTAMSNAIADLSPFTASMVSFFALLAVATAALVVTLTRTFGTLRLPRRLASVDQMGGSALGVLTATFSILVGVLALSSFFRLVQGAADAGVNVWPIALSLGSQLRLSFLARYFVDLGKPLILLMAPWFPNGLPSILTSVL